jgi:autotransporter-associated beta strand protein
MKAEIKSRKLPGVAPGCSGRESCKEKPKNILLKDFAQRGLARILETTHNHGGVLAPRPSKERPCRGTRGCLLLLWLICVAATWVRPAFTQTLRHWTGQDSGNWSDPNNWISGTGHGAPQNGDSLFFGFNFSGDSNDNMTNDMIGLSVSTLTFGNNSYELNGFSLTVTQLIDNTDEGGVTNGLGVNSETVDINCPVVFQGFAEVNSGNAPGQLTQTTLYTHLNGPITLQGTPLTLWAQSKAGGGGGNGHIYVSGGITDTTGVANVYAIADDDGSGDVSSVEFDGTHGKPISGTLSVSTSGNAQIIFNAGDGFVATNEVLAAPYRGSFASTSENITFAAPNQLGDYTALVVSNGLTLHLSGHNVTVGSLELENQSGDTNASTLDIDGIELGLNHNLTSSDLNSNLEPVITGYINLNAVVNCNITGVGSNAAALYLAATLASQGGLSINGNAALLLEASNFFSGPVIVNSGNLVLLNDGALGGSGAVKSSGVQLNGGIMTLNLVDIPETPLTVTSPNSSLVGFGSCAWESSIMLDDPLPVFAYGTLQLNGTLLGTNDLTLYEDNVELGGKLPGDMTGTIYSSCAVLALGNGLSSGPGNEVTDGPLVIGNPGGAACEVLWQGSYELYSGAQPPVTIYPGGVMNLNGFEDVIGSLTFNGGSLGFNGGTVTLGTFGELMPGPVLVNSNAGLVSIEGGQLDTGPQLGSVTDPASSVSAIDVEQGSTLTSLTISSSIVGNHGITKLGTATLILSGSNTFTGENLISNGVVQVNSPTGLGSAANATTVETGAQLDFETNVTIGPMLTNNGSVLLDFVLLEPGITLDLSGGLTNSGTVSIFSGATLTLGTGGTSGSTSDSIISGAGNLLVEGPANFAGTVNVAGSNIFNLPEFDVANLTGDYICTNNVLAIDGGIVNFDGTGIVAPATLTVNTFCTLGGSNLVTVSGPTTLNTSSTLSGTNLVVANGGLTIPGGLSISGRTLVNNGTCNWNGAGAIGLNNSATLSNGPAGTFNCTAGGTVQNSSGNNLVANAGLFLTTGGTATTTISPPFNNSGTVEVQSGTLSLSGGLTDSGGITINSGSTLFVGSAAVNSLSTPGSSITGAGNVEFGGTGNFAGTVNVAGTNMFNNGTATFAGPYTCTNNAMIISGGTANFNGTGVIAPATLTVNTFGTLGGSNLVSVSGSTVFGSSSALSGANQVIANGGLTILSGLSISGRTLVNTASGLWTNSQGGVPNLGLSSGGVLSNAPGANLEFNGNDNVGLSTGGGAVVNAGTFLKTGAGSTSTLNAPFTNSGQVNIVAGTLALGGGGMSSANISVTSGAGIQFSGGTFTLPPGASISGAGSFTVSAGTPNFAGTVNLGGSNTISGGTATFTGPYICTNNALTIGGTANFNGTGVIAPASLTVNTFGTLGGSNLVSVSGPTVFGSSSALSGSNLVVANGGLTILSGLSISGRTLVNTASGLWTNSLGGVPGLGMSFGAVLSNAPGANLQFAGSDNIGFSTGGGAVVNAGTFLKTGAGSTSTVSVPFNNNGTVSIQSGVLAAGGGYVSASNAILNCVLGGTTAGINYGQLQVSGAVTLLGTLSVNFAGGYSPKTNDSFTVVTAGTRNGTFANFTCPSNLVTMQLSNTATSVIVRVTGITVPPPVVLYIAKLTGSNAMCYWSTNVSGYHLEYNGGLGATNWAASLKIPVVVGTNFVVTNSLLAARKFYRLSSVAAPYTPPAPVLGITPVSGGMVQLIWPIDDDRPLGLKSATNVSPANWAAVSTAASTIGTNNVVTIAVGRASQFFRLSNQ